MQAVAFTARQVGHTLLLVGALEVETTYIGSRRGFVVTDLDNIVAVAELFPDGVVAVQVPHLVHVGQFYGFTDCDGAGIGLVVVADHPEQRGLARAVATDDANDRTRGHTERDVFVEQAVIEGLADAIDLNHLVTQARARWDV